MTFSPPLLLILSFLLLSPTLLSSTPLATTATEKIIGGNEVSSSEKYPWIVFLSYSCPDQPKAFCAGSVIGPDVVMTAAHCFDEGCGSQVKGEVKVGVDRENPRETRKLRIWTTVAEYDGGFDNDIALWFVDKEFDKVDEYAKIPGEDLGEGEEVRAAGWGLDGEGDIPSKLREVKLEIQPDSVCERSFGDDYDEETQICAGVDGGGKDTCNGDSGGPLFDGRTVYGITSFGTDCAKEDGAVYTRVTAFSGWIERTIEKHSDSELGEDGTATDGGSVVGVFVGGWVVVLGVLVLQF